MWATITIENQFEANVAERNATIEEATEACRFIGATAEACDDGFLLEIPWAMSSPDDGVKFAELGVEIPGPGHPLLATIRWEID